MAIHYQVITAVSPEALVTAIDVFVTANPTWATEGNVYYDKDQLLWCQAVKKGGS